MNAATPLLMDSMGASDLIGNAKDIYCRAGPLLPLLVVLVSGIYSYIMLIPGLVGCPFHTGLSLVYIPAIVLLFGWVADYTTHTDVWLFLSTTCAHTLATLYCLCTIWEHNQATGCDGGVCFLLFGGLPVVVYVLLSELLRILQQAAVYHRSADPSTRIQRRMLLVKECHTIRTRQSLLINPALGVAFGYVWCFAVAV